MHNNINSSMYIDLKTFIAVLRNVSLFDLNEYNINNNESNMFVNIFNNQFSQQKILIIK